MTHSNSNTQPQPTPADDSEELVCNAVDLFTEWGCAISGLIRRQSALSDPQASMRDLHATLDAMSEIAECWMNDPARTVAAQSELCLSYVDLWCASMLKAFGSDAEPVAEPKPADNRFKDPEWVTNPYFDFWKQAYLLTANWSEDFLRQTEGLDDRSRDKAEFYLRQVLSAMSPSNFPLTNP